MKKMLSNLSIRHKVWGALGLMMVLLAVIVALSYVSLSGVEKRVTRVVKEIQPTVIQAQELNAHLEASARSLGFFLLSKEEEHKTAYLDSLAAGQKSLKALKGNTLIGQSPETAALLAQIAADVQAFADYQARLFELEADPAKNIPAIAQSGRDLNPLSQQMLQNLSSMVQSESMEAATDTRKAILSSIHDLRYAWANVMNGVRAYLAFRNASAVQEIELYKSEVERVLGILQERENDLTFDQADSLEQFANLSKTFFENFKAVEALHSSDQWRVDAHLIRSEIGPLLARVEHDLNELAGILIAQADATGTALIDTVESSLLTQAVLLGAGLLLGALVMLGSAIFIVKPAQRLRDLLRDISEGEGDLTQRANLAANDELGQASRYFDNMMANMQGMIRDIAEVAGAVHSRSDLAAGEIQAVTSNVNQSADRARNTAAATEEMSATGAEIARNAGQAAEEAAEVQQVSEDGAQRVTQMSDRARDMGGQIGNLRRDVEQLGEKSKGMLDMVAIINDIANQTNLLALNAAIEAARAGESGRGFAVVADEVRQLAMKTQDSTSQITALITDNLQSNEHLASVMEKVSGATESMLSAVTETSAVIERMSGSVQVMNDKASQIATAAREQSVATDEVAGNIESISAMENENSQRTGEVASHLEELTDLSSRLDRLVGHFKV